ncbi:MAG: hypothetical protein HYZ25_09450 [Chloroflexi bacterium]|nr:hypothetical protein [Chloroflexota bacterium]
MKKNLNLEIIASLSFVFLIFIIDGIRLYFSERLDIGEIFKKEVHDLRMIFILMVIGAIIAVVLVFVYMTISKKRKPTTNLTNNEK